MSKRLVVCPGCRQQVPEGKYCNLCGSELLTADPPEPLLLPEEVEEQMHIVEDAPTMELPAFDIVIEDMPARDAAVLLSRAELEVLDGELERIIDQTRATRQALKLKQADREVLTKRAEELKSEFERLRSRKQELSRAGGSLLLENLLNEFEHQEERLTKLKAIAGSVDKDVFEEQKSDIIQKLKSLRSQIKAAVKDAKKWRKGIVKTEKTLQKELSRLDAKHKIGDISRSSYDASSYRTRRGMKLLEGGADRLDALLARAGDK